MFNDLTTLLLDYLQIRREQYSFFTRLLDNENLSNQRMHSLLQQHQSLQRTTANQTNQRNIREQSIDEMTGILSALNSINTRTPTTPILRTTARGRGFSAAPRSGRSTRFWNATIPTRNIRTQTLPTLPPTTTQIQNSTTELKYCDASTNQTICSISRNEFQPNDEILKINHCGHIFKKESLKTWFRTKATCPLCRYNIVTGVTENSTSLPV
jgi:hypothetical protein